MKNSLKISVFFLLLSIILPLTAFAAVSGRVLDSVTLKPIKDAIVTVHGEVVRTDERGLFQSRASGDRVLVRATGYLRSERAASPQPLLEVRLTPFSPKALYLTVYGAGDRKIRNEALRLIDETELNALVIDVKGDRGFIPYKSTVPLATRIGAQKIITIRDMKGQVSSFKEKGIYLIARIVTFKDFNLAAEFPNIQAICHGALHI
ncbi:MAG: hypothetical protein HGA78_02255 [Nitrospirales bacterium]|nr:hypothetical protein [Nitrospirales bacterium]